MTEEVSTESGSGLKVYVIAALLIGGIFAWQLSHKENFTPPTPGNLAPSTTYTNALGDKVSLEDYRGKVILLNFWSTTCVECIKENPALALLSQALRSLDDFVFLSVSIDTDGAAAVEPHLAEKGIDLPMLYDHRRLAFSKFRGTGTPETYVIDREGVIRHKYLGARNWYESENLADLIEVLGMPADKVEQMLSAALPAASKGS